MCNSHEHRQTAGFIPSAQGLILGEIPGAQILLEPSAKSGRAALSPLAGPIPAARPASTAILRAAAAPPDARTQVNYCLRNAGSGLYLTADGAETGSNCTQRAFAGTPNQVWYLTQESGGWQLAPRHSPGRRLAVLSGSAAEGANVGLALGKDPPETAQLWTLSKNARGCYVLYSRASGGARALCVNPANASAEGANVAQYAYTDNAALNDEWALEPFIAPYMEYDQGYFMYHSGYSGLAIQERLNSIANEALSILYGEYGLRPAPSVSEMIPSLADDCAGMLYLCEHGGPCTNTYSGEEDALHHNNWPKQLYWYQARGRYDNGFHLLWDGHRKCTNASGRHSNFGLGEQFYYASVPLKPYIAMNLPLNVTFEQLVALTLRGISDIFGAQSTAHDSSCIADPNSNTQTIYNAVKNGAQRSFWCSACHARMLANIDKFSNSPA